MKNECSIVRDILPLYAEKMVSKDTAEFVKGHLENCHVCRAELEKLREPVEVQAADGYRRRAAETAEKGVAD